LQFTSNNAIPTFVCNQKQQESQTTISLKFANNAQLVDKIDRKTYVKIPGLASRPEIPENNTTVNHNVKNDEQDQLYENLNDVVQIDDNNINTNNHTKAKTNNKNKNVDNNNERFEEIFWPEGEM